MTKKERLLTAMKRGIPDRVPCSPDTNWMIPAKLKKKPFWEVYYHNDPPIWKAYNDCVKYFGIEGFSHHGYAQIPGHPQAKGWDKILEQTEEKLVVEHHFECPLGKLTSETTFLKDEAPTDTRNMITDLEKQFDFLPYLLGDYQHAKFDTYKQIQEDMGDHGAVGLCMYLPTLMFFLREPRMQAYYDYFEHAELIERYIQMETDKLVSIAQQIIDQKVNPDFVFFPNSGLITMQSEEIAQRFAFPALKKLTAMFQKAGIVTSLHSCGKEYAIVRYAAENTDLNCIDPLEIAPMGDCDLAMVKKEFGHKLAIKGNLHTTQVMLMMNADQVEIEARKALDAAMENGGYILSTGDQCGRDTPEENIFRLLEVCERYGKY